MKCKKPISLIILFTLMKVSLSVPVPDPKPEPCLSFIFSLLASLFRPFSFGGFGGQLGPQFVSSPQYVMYYPGMYYGAPYVPYQYYQYPYMVGPGQGPIIVNPGGPNVIPGRPGTPIVVDPGRPIVVDPGRPIVVDPGRPIVVDPGRPIVVDPDRPIIDVPDRPSRPIIDLGK